MTSSRRKAAAPLVLLLVTATACVERDAPGVAVKSLETDVVFGVKIKPPAAPPGAAPVELAPVVTAPSTPELPAFEPVPVAPPPPPALPPVTVPTRQFCPVAPADDAPEGATLASKGTPTAGVYLWRNGPAEVFGSPVIPGVSATTVFRRVVQNVSKVTSTPNNVNSQPSPIGDGAPHNTTTFSYEVVTYFTDGSGQLDGFKVVDDGITQTVSSGANIGPTYYAGQPDRGLVLTKSIRFNNKQQATAAFQPGDAGVLLFPLPAITGGRWQSMGVDALNGATYSVTGEVRERHRVDACGKLVDGWQATMQTVFAPGGGTAPVSGQYTIHVSTQLGSLITYEKLSELEAPSNPANGTPLDNAIPPPPSTGASAPAGAYERGLASATPTKA